jgi:hypothetical protein
MTTPEEKRLARNQRERDRLRAKRALLLPKLTEEEKRTKLVQQNKRKREYNRDRQRKIRQQENELVFNILSAQTV